MRLNKIYVNGEATFVEAWSPKQSGICPFQEETDISPTHFVANGRRLYRPEVVAGQLYQSGMDPVTAWTTAGALINRDDGLVDPSAYLAEPTGIMGAANFVGAGIMGFADYRDYYLAEKLREAGIEGEQDVAWQKLENLNPESKNEALRNTRYAFKQLAQPEEEQNSIPRMLPKPKVLVAGVGGFSYPYMNDVAAKIALIERAVISVRTVQDIREAWPLFSQFERGLDKGWSGGFIASYISDKSFDARAKLPIPSVEGFRGIESWRQAAFTVIKQYREALADCEQILTTPSMAEEWRWMQKEAWGRPILQETRSLPPRYKWLAIGAAAVTAYLCFSGED